MNLGVEGSKETAFQNAQQWLTFSLTKASRSLGLTSAKIPGHEELYNMPALADWQKQIRSGGWKDYSPMTKYLPPEVAQTFNQLLTDKNAPVGDANKLRALAENLSIYHLGEAGKLPKEAQEAYKENAPAFKALAAGFESKEGLKLLRENPKEIYDALRDAVSTMGPQNQFTVDILELMRALVNNTSIKNEIWSDVNAGK
jgi:hypothetical protein